MKSGFIAILGKPNVGKSSLMNRLIGEKVSIVSPKAQTTRDKILGIVTTDEYQMIFVDTPGVHVPKTQLGEYMSRAATVAAGDVDAIVIVLDASKGVGESDIAFIEKHLRKKIPLFVAVNKTDLAGFEKVYPILSKLSHLMQAEGGRAAIKEIVPLSCRSGENIELLKKFIASVLPEGECYFPPDDITDKSERYLICEIVREKALLYLQDEIPHGVGAYIQSMEKDGDIVNVEVDIVCEKESHKQIIIGKGGEMLKTIGEKARADIEKMLSEKVYLKLYVKVRENWRNKKSTLADMGYDNKFF